MIPLKHGDLRANVSSYGAALRSFCLEPNQPIVWGYADRSAKRGGQGDVLIPFPGRIRGGTYRFAGEEHRLAHNDKQGPNAIHGFVRSMDWKTESVTEASARFRVRIDSPPGYPFQLQARVGYSLSDKGLQCDFELANLGSRAAPVGAGFHPYFVCGTLDDAILSVPAKSMVEFGDDLLPTGRIVPVTGTPLDFVRPKRIGSFHFNHCYTDLERDSSGRAEVSLRSSSGRTVRVWMDGAFPYLVIYSGDAIEPPHARAALAIEPMTCATDAFNRPKWGLVALEPGQSFRGAWGAELS